jgi:hypothetical protein
VVALEPRITSKFGLPLVGTTSPTQLVGVLQLVLRPLCPSKVAAIAVVPTPGDARHKAEKIAPPYDNRARACPQRLIAIVDRSIRPAPCSKFLKERQFGPH